jgi:hypothetical protein
LVELKALLADMQRDRDEWRHQAKRLALPKPEEEPKMLTWWERLGRSTGCLAGVSLVLAFATSGAGAQQQQLQPQVSSCWRVVMNHSTGGGSLGAIMVNECTGNTWQLVRTTLSNGAQVERWHPITLEQTEAAARGR